MECGGKEVRADAVWVSMPFRVEGPVINALAFLPRLIAVLGRHYSSAARTPALSRIAQERGPCSTSERASKLTVRPRAHYVSSSQLRTFGRMRLCRRSANTGREQHRYWCGTLCNAYGGDDCKALLARLAVMPSRPMIANRCMRRRMGDHVVTEVRKSRLSLVYLPEASCAVPMPIG